MLPIVVMAIEKIFTCLVMPCGLIWLALIALTFLAWRRKQRALFVSLLVLLVFHTLAGNEEVSKLLLVWLERDYVKIEPLEQGPYDVVFVLGGGTDTTPVGEAQLSLAGDRAGLAARLYHCGRAERLVALGMVVRGPGGQPLDLGEAESRIWQQWGIAGDRIFRLTGRNTREEMASIRKFVGEHPEWRRLGLVTSAWHMRRAMRLAKNNDLRLDPLPADFRGNVPQWQPWSLLIPNDSGFRNSHIACKEILAGLVGK